jgi:hypothetical protein
VYCQRFARYWPDGVMETFGSSAPVCRRGPPMCASLTPEAILCRGFGAHAPEVAYCRPRAERNRSALMRPGTPSSAGKLSRSLIRSARRVGSPAACRGV